MSDPTPLDRLCEILKRCGPDNITSLTYFFFGVRQVRGGVYPTLTFVTEDQRTVVRKLIQRGRREGRIEKLSSGRWTQYQLRESP